jgi:hypothetical protein
MDYFPSMTFTRVECINKSFGDVRQIVPETLGEAADIEKTTIQYLCLAAVYQLLEEGKLSITDVQQAYQRGSASSSS